MEITVEQIKRIVEASLLMSREPQTAKKLAELFTEEENINERAIIDTLTMLAEDYRGRGVELVEVATGYRFQVCADLAPWIQRTMAEKPQRYSRALLETLALIAYRQPITRAEIEEIRGVVVSTQIMRTLEEREWVRVIGHRDVPGRPALYATTKQFLNDLNLKSLGELPTLAELQDLDKVEGEFQQLNLDVSTPQASALEANTDVNLDDSSVVEENALAGENQDTNSGLVNEEKQATEITNEDEIQNHAALETIAAEEDEDDSHAELEANPSEEDETENGQESKNIFADEADSDDDETDLLEDEDELEEDEAFEEELGEVAE